MTFSQKDMNRAVVLGTVLAGSVLSVGAWLFSWYATHPPRRKVGAWRGKDLPVEEVTFPSRDGLRLAGWFAPVNEEAKGLVILCHGHPANRVEMLPEARILYKAGFHVLLFDFRALGESEGKTCTLGLAEVQDLMGAIDYLMEREEARGLKLGVLGLSMGGAVSLMTAAQDTRIQAVATHGAFGSLESAIRRRAELFTGFLAPVTAKMATQFGKRWIPPTEDSPLTLVSRIAPRPLLLLHGVKDHIIPLKEGEKLYAEAGEPKELVPLPLSYHVGIHHEEQAAYNEKIVTFFIESLTQ